MIERRRLDVLAAISLLAVLSLAVAPELTAQDDPMAMLHCYELARNETLLDSTESQQLCRGAFTTGPVDCYIAGDDETFLDTDDLMTLCRCAESAAPVTCFLQGRIRSDLSVPDALHFCSPIFVHHLWLDCTPRQNSR